MITDEELASLLDPSLISQHPTPGELASYFRTRTSVPWKTDLRSVGDPADGGHDQGYADAIVRGEFNEQNIPHTFPNAEVDWHYNPTRIDMDLPINNEWQWQLGRMSYWPNLGRTYRATRDETYAETFVNHLRSWAEQCVRPDDSGNYAESPWRTIESGIRMARSWPDTYHLFLDSPTFTDEDILLFLKVCVEHGHHLRTHHKPRGNWLTMKMAGLYTIGAAFPELKELAAW